MKFHIGSYKTFNTKWHAPYFLRGSKMMGNAGWQLSVIISYRHYYIGRWYED